MMRGVVVGVVVVYGTSLLQNFIVNLFSLLMTGGTLTHAQQASGC
jgi:hypothetical protein